MTNFNIANPVFVTYLVTASIMILKVMIQGWITVYRMMSVKGGFASPEDLQPGPINRNPSPTQLEANEYVERSRRMHRNDLENIPAFLVAALLFVAVRPSLVLADVLMYGFVVARLAHSMAYATKQRHEVRATLYTIGSLFVIFMAVYVLVVALST